MNDTFTHGPIGPFSRPKYRNKKACQHLCKSKEAHHQIAVFKFVQWTWRHGGRCSRHGVSSWRCSVPCPTEMIKIFIETILWNFKYIRKLEVSKRYLAGVGYLSAFVCNTMNSKGETLFEDVYAPYISLPPPFNGSTELRSPFYPTTVACKSYAVTKAESTRKENPF